MKLKKTHFRHNQIIGGFKIKSLNLYFLIKYFSGVQGQL